MESNHLTHIQQVLFRKYILYQFLTNLWFVGAIWLYFYRIFITDQQVGILDGIAFAIGLIAEVPSGALADRFGRDTLVKVGQVLAGSGLLIQALGSSFLPFFSGQVIMLIGLSFVSGADEALFFSSFKFNRNSKDWRKVVTRGSQFALIGTLLATVAGGWLYSIHPRIPWVLNGFAFVSSALVIWTIKDTQIRKGKDKVVTEIRNYIANIKQGFLQFRAPKMWLYVPIIFTVQGGLYAVDWGILRLILLSRFEFSPFLGSVAIAVCGLITIGALKITYDHAEKLSEKRVIASISLVTLFSFVISILDIGRWGFMVILLLYLAEQILQPFMSEVLNYRTSEDQRATVLSVANFIRILPYVVLSPLLGYLNTRNQLEYFLLGWAVLIGVALLMYLTLKKKDSYIHIAEEDLVLETDSQKI